MFKVNFDIYHDIEGLGTSLNVITKHSEVALKKKHPLHCEEVLSVRYESTKG